MLSQRQREPEAMDDPALARGELEGALGGLMRLNRLSASSRIVWQPIERLARQKKLERLRILDIATGAGDVPLALWRRAQRAGIDVEICGIDFNPQSIEFARQRAAAAGAKITFECRDALDDDLPAGYDCLTTSLFLHHLSDDDARKLLTRMAAAARRMVLVSDLRRDPWGLSLAWLIPRLMTRSPIVHVDAVRSVRAAFTPAELRQHAGQAGLAGATVARRWPARMLLTWHKRQN
jgi:2-polyprenyl-3-methyl-5-hydroxy-6-metoxy-1,4-benzoquinol methylase